jgi:hypothetical protein
MSTDPFAVLKTIFKPKTVVTQQNDFYKVYRAAYSDRRLFYKQGITIFFLLLLTVFIGLASYSFLAQKTFLGPLANPWAILFSFLILLAFIPLVCFTFKANQITAFILFTILLFLTPIIQLSLKGTIYWQLIIPLFVFVALTLIGIGRMKMTADNQMDFNWWQIASAGGRFFVYGYLCLIFVFGFWIIKSGSLKQKVDWEKTLTQSVSGPMKRIIPQINLEGSIDDFLSGIIDQQLKTTPLSTDTVTSVPSQIVTATTNSSSKNSKSPTTTKVKSVPTTLPNYNTLIAQETAKQKNLLLESTRNQLAKLLKIPVTGKETIFGLIKNFVTAKFKTWGPIVTSILVLVVALVLWQTINLLVSVIYVFVSIFSYVLLKIFLKTKFLQFKTVNIPHKILALNED